MTPVEQKRAAKSARKLAMEIVNGRRLELNSGDYCGCAAHYVAVGAKLPGAQPWTGGIGSAARAIDKSIPDNGGHLKLGLLTEATNEAVVTHDQTVLVFPLLATADALDALAAGHAP